MDPQLLTKIRQAHLAALKASRQRDSEQEASILSRTRRSLGSRRQHGTVAEINNTVFDYKGFLPYRMPAVSQTTSILPANFEARFKLLQPATLLETYKNQDVIIYYWQRIHSAKSRTCYNWTIPREWGDYDVMMLGHFFKSVLLALIYIWHSQRKFIEGHPRILLKDELLGQPLLMGEQSIIFEDIDLWKLMGGKYSDLNPTKLDRTLKTLYALNFCRSIFEKGQWKGYHYGHVINELVFGSALNPKLRYAEIALRYLLPPEHIPNELAGRTYTPVRPMDIELERSLSPEQSAFFRFFYHPYASYTVNERHPWRLDRFYELVLHKDASYINSLAKARMLGAHLVGIWKEVNKKLKHEDLQLIPKPAILPKRKGQEIAGQQKVKFFPVLKSIIHS